MLIYNSINKGLTFRDVNDALKAAKEKTIAEPEFIVWENYLFPIAKSDTLLYQSIIEEGLDISQVGALLWKRSKKSGIS